ncbi:MAG: phage tail tape measure protein, partial [Candidatus Promineofilum sp.]|nr:phage tail tape measure protein [Promineifilum sp.]
AALRAHGLQKQLEKTGTTLSKMLFGGDLKTTFVTGAFLSLGREVENIFQSWFQNVQEWINTSNQQFDAYRQSITQTFAMIPATSAMARDAMIQDVMAIGTEYGYLTEQTMPALQKALQLGVAQADIGDTLEASARAARVSGGDYVQMLASGQNIINAYGGKLKDLNEVYELLYFAQRNAGVGADSLTQHLAPIIAVTGDLGVSLEDVIAAVVTMVKQGDDLESVSSLLSNMFTQIQISGTALGGVFEEAAKTDFRTFIANGGTLLDAMRLIEEQAKKTGTSIPSLVGGDSNFYRDQQAMIAVLELTNQHLGELAAISGEVRAGQELIADGYQQIADEAFMASERTAAQIEQMNLKAAESWEPVRFWWAEFKANTAENIGGGFAIDTADEEFEAFTATIARAGDTLLETRDRAQLLQEALRVGATDDSMWANEGQLNNLKSLGRFVMGGDYLLDAEHYTTALALAQKLLAENTSASNKELVQTSLAIADIVVAARANEAPTDEMMVDLQALQELFPATYREVRTFLAELGLAPPLLQQTGDSVLFLSNELEKLGLKGKTAFYNISITDEAVLERMRYGVEDISRVLDGDTMQALFSGGEKPITIRLPDIDTPEIAKMIDGKLQGQNQAYGQRARVFTERWLLEVEDITVSAEKGQDDFKRSLRDVKGEIDGEMRSLQDDLIAAGLAIPLDLQINLTKGAKERFQQQMQMAMDAARQGLGMFENDLARAMFLEGSIDSTPEIAAIIEAQANYFPQGIQWAQQMTEAQEQLNDATGEYVTTYRDNASEIAQIQAKLNADLSDDQKKALNDELDALDKYSERAVQIAQQLAADLSDNERAELIGKLGDLQGTQGQQMTSYTGDIEAAEEAGKKILEIQQQVEDELKQHAWDSVFNFEGLTDQTADLAVALGLLTQEEADFALSYAQRKTALEQLPAAFAQVTLSAEQEAQAIQLIIDGAVTTAEEAIRRVQVLALNNAAPREEDAYYTERYWKMAEEFDMEPVPAEETYIYYTPIIAAEAQEAFSSSLIEFGEQERPVWFTPTDTPERGRTVYRGALAEWFFAHPVDAPVDGDVEPAKDAWSVLQSWYDQHPIIVRVISETENPNDPNGPGAEGGGHVTAGRAYIVGEQGEELFIPYTNGRIVPNHQIHEARGETTINVAIDARGNANYNQIGRSARQGVISAAKRMGIP